MQYCHFQCLSVCLPACLPAVMATGYVPDPAPAPGCADLAAESPPGQMGAYPTGKCLGPQGLNTTVDGKGPGLEPTGLELGWP